MRSDSGVKASVRGTCAGGHRMRSAKTGGGDLQGTALMVEAEFFGRDRPRAGFRDRHGEIRGLTVEQYIKRLGQGLIPLAERCARVMREAIASLETLGAAPSHAVERSRPARILVMFEPRPPG